MSPSISEAYLVSARQEIADWENQKRGYFGRLSDMAFDPAAKLTSKVIPQSVKESTGDIIEKSLHLASHATHFSVDHVGILKEREKAIGRKKTLGTILKALDKIAKQHWTHHCGLAAAQGAATGIAGGAGLLADIPLSLSIAIRQIRTLSLCYGYDPLDPTETDYVLNVLRIGSATDPEMRATVLRLLKAFEAAKINSASRVKHLVSIHEYAKSLAVGILRRKAFQIVPLAGAVTGASFNALYANDVGRAAYMCYRRRFMLDGVVSRN
jgi:hypothetical protein